MTTHLWLFCGYSGFPSLNITLHNGAFLMCNVTFYCINDNQDKFFVPLFQVVGKKTITEAAIFF